MVLSWMVGVGRYSTERNFVCPPHIKKLNKKIDKY